MTYLKPVLTVLAVMLSLAQASLAREMPAPSTAPAGGQLVSGKFARVVIPEGWKWSASGAVITASPKVPLSFFQLEDPKLTDDMATCYDLAGVQSMKGASQSYLDEFVADQIAKQTAAMNKIDDADARAVAFVERRMTGGLAMMVAVVPDRADQFGAAFTGIVFLEAPSARFHFVCKATFSKSNGAYATRPTMKALLQLINSYTPL